MRAAYWMGLCLAAAVAAPAAGLAQGQPAGDRMKAMFDRVDTNHDGYISRDEADAAGAAMRQRMQERRTAQRDKAFARLDSNGDGAISRPEFDSAPRVAGQARRGQPGRGGAQGGAGGGGMLSAMFDRMDADHDGRVSLAEAEAAAQQRMAIRGRRAPAGDASERPLGEGRN
ncbi:EF-hand domain-containing protein [Sphingomonas quercus]|uniref:EF-hand domain-containing protein n=1 Tax=Sphingomonas quercus TaxID=2842451 RepID=A0ABS6BIG8_9SPHN|nr:EF-hand domain-containing protein [Sphingomonas quercus]MBU3077241.1 EF-hand domain-containing protein [Sphingomonas quercus]